MGYQSLLMLERHLTATSRPPLMVLYGYADFHPERNVAALYWVKGLAMYSSRGHVRVPYCLIDKAGTLQRYPPLEYAVHFWNTHSAAIDYFTTRYLDLMSKRREARQEAVTQKLLLAMDAACRRKGTRLVVLFLGSTRENRVRYSEFFRQHGIDSIDCMLVTQLFVVG